jgi:hypothetical protein
LGDLLHGKVGNKSTRGESGSLAVDTRSSPVTCGDLDDIPLKVHRFGFATAVILARKKAKGLKLLRSQKYLDLTAQRWLFWEL